MDWESKRLAMALFAGRSAIGHSCVVTWFYLNDTPDQATWLDETKNRL